MWFDETTVQYWALLQYDWTFDLQLLVSSSFSPKEHNLNFYITFTRMWWTALKHDAADHGCHRCIKLSPESPTCPAGRLHIPSVVQNSDFTFSPIIEPTHPVSSATEETVCRLTADLEIPPDTCPPRQQSWWFHFSLCVHFQQIRCVSAPSSFGSPELDGADTQDFYFWRMPEHNAAIQLNLAPSRQKSHTETAI